MLAGTRSGDELGRDVVTSADLWSFGCSTLKMFISHSGPSSQQEVCVCVCVCVCGWVCGCGCVCMCVCVFVYMVV